MPAARASCSMKGRRVGQRPPPRVGPAHVDRLALHTSTASRGSEVRRQLWKHVESGPPRLALGPKTIMGHVWVRFRVKILGILAFDRPKLAPNDRGCLTLHIGGNAVRGKDARFSVQPVILSAPL